MVQDAWKFLLIQETFTCFSRANKLHTDREDVELEDIPFVKEWLKDQ